MFTAALTSPWEGPAVLVVYRMTCRWWGTFARNWDLQGETKQPLALIPFFKPSIVSIWMLSLWVLCFVLFGLILFWSVVGLLALSCTCLHCCMMKHMNKCNNEFKWPLNCCEQLSDEWNLLISKQDQVYCSFLDIQSDYVFIGICLLLFAIHC